VTLAELCAAARRERPELAFDDAVLAEAVASLAGELEPARCRAGDFALAQLAARGDRDAIRILEREHDATIARVCRRFAGHGHDPDDLRQILRDKLWVARPAALASYNGLGSLSSWLRILATRTFIDLGRRKDRAREELSPAAVEHALAPEDLALELIKAEYRDAVKRALLRAVDQLERGDRHLLRQHLVEALTIDQLAAVLGIHRSTVARRIANAKDRLAEATRMHLRAELALDEAELAQLVELVASKLELSMRTLLQSRPA
jgi:RNA polymerase sigma-70 factor (ECF subfamily)